MKESHFLNEKS